MTAWNARHHRSLIFLLIIASLAGGWLAFKLPVALFPKTDFPRVMVEIEAGDQPVEQMVLQVTKPMEEAVRGVPGARDVRSTSSRGAADISINFDWGTDMAVATLQINAALAPLLQSLPAGTKLTVRRMDTTVFPIIAYSLTSDKTPLTQLHDIAQYQLLPLITRISGVAQVQVIDNAKAEYRVTADPDKLRAYGLTLDDMAAALNATNTISAVGRLEEHYKLYLVVTDSRLHDPADIASVPIKNTGKGLVRVRDVATVSAETVPEWVKVTADGKDAVLLQVLQQPGSNSVQMSADIRKALGDYRPQLPKDVQLTNWYDQSLLVVASAGSVRDAILIGVVLAAAVLFLFLRNWHVTLVAIIMVPAVLAVTVIVLQVFGMSFNIMTLGGMAAAVGLIIDDAIVMLEHIIRRTRETHPEQATKNNPIMLAAHEFFQPLIGSSSATIIIFVPLVFLSGVTGAFFKALSLTMGCALIISFLITWQIVPLLSNLIAGPEKLQNGHKPGKRHSLAERYSDVMQRALAKPYLLLLGMAPLLLIGALAYFNVGSGFMPSIDEGGFVFDYRAEPGTSLKETDRLLRQVEADISAIPEVATFSRRTGAQFGGGLTEAFQGDFYVTLKPFPRKSLDTVMEEVRVKITHDVPGLDIELAKLMEDEIGDLTSVPQPVEIKIFSDNPDQLMMLARKINEAIAKVSGVVDNRDGVNPAGDALDVHIDPDKAALEGMDVASISKQLNSYLSGNVATDILRPVKLEGVRVWIPEALHATRQNIEQLGIRAPDGHVFPISRVASIDTVTGQPEVTRENLKRMVAVTARIEGRDIGSVMTDIKKILNKPGMFPKGVTYELGGLYQQQQIAFHDMIIIFAAAVALVFLLLLFLYEDFAVAIAIMLMPLLSLAAVFLGLWLTGVDLNISAMMGMTMIVGIVTEVSIFYFSEYYSLRGEHGHDDALIEAGVNRARPIIMTTLAAILTLLPLAFAWGQGAAMQQPLAIAIISGLLVQLPLVLIVMPVLFNMMLRLRKNPRL
ncbi:MAG: efflux RND transporter permease subunit [Pseudomonadota bacterium]|nr:efflux RND transporter permease subunit [Pseudomonadota bacterium]